MATAPKVSHITAKQRAADVANLRKARAVARKLPRTGKQKAASRHNLAKARAAQKSRRSGKQAVAPKQAAAPDSRETSPGTTGELAGGLNKPAPRLHPTGLPASVHDFPACVPVALAAHLLWWTGAEASDDEILALHDLLGGAATIPDAIEAAAECGFSGVRPDTRARCDVSTRGVPGLIYGLAVPTGYHAVLALPAGVLSWGTVLSWPGEPAEAWHLEWEAA
jgi:hypothetical protein